ncbi:hypothetical protein RF11_04832 [Thelohanellus kitauei]|uniref:Uncharacterized protein n=1 Tax=Thelohanellus kitauei TaxID=669202 RepID=A0A0C2J0V1_THEKT|nr:hypothetical protein RF11_04832 [Thelohanellus kitauei]
MDPNLSQSMREIIEAYFQLCFLYSEFIEMYPQGNLSTKLSENINKTYAKIIRNTDQVSRGLKVANLSTTFESSRLTCRYSGRAGTSLMSGDISSIVNKRLFFFSNIQSICRFMGDECLPYLKNLCHPSIASFYGTVQKKLVRNNFKLVEALELTLSFYFVI